MSNLLNFHYQKLRLRPSSWNFEANLELAEKPEEEHDGFVVDRGLELRWNWYQRVRERIWNERRAITTGHGIIRLKKSNKMQQYAVTYLLLNFSTCFGRPSRLSSEVHKTIVAASGTDHTIWEASILKRDQIRTYLVTSEEACSPDSMNCTRGCNYSFMYSWWWAR